MGVGSSWTASGGVSGPLACSKVLIIGVDDDENPRWATQMRLKNLERRVDYVEETTFGSALVSSFPTGVVELIVEGYEDGEFTIYPPKS